MTISPIATARPPVANPDRLFIGGEWVKASTGAKIDVISAATEEVYLQVAEAQPADMERAIAAARRAFDHGPWPRLSHAERGNWLRKLAAGLTERGGDIAAMWPHEMGILYKAAAAMSAGAGATFNYYADMAETFPFEEPRKAAGEGLFGLVVREPVGVVGAIIPWNAPVSMISWKVAPALLAGCTVVVKASPEAPGAAYVFAEVAEAIGMPAGVVNVVTADREVSELLVRSPLVDKISFTGSTAAGRRIASICGERIARVTLELGGKSAAVILDDYDPELAAAKIAGPACALTGQICSSLTRIVVPRSRHDALVEALAARFKAVRIGNPFDDESEIGPIAVERQRTRIEGLIASGVAEGATLAAGGGRPSHLNRGFYVEPTVFGNVENSMRIAQEEIFGPVLSIIPAEDEADAIAIANDTIYGLNNSVFTHDADRAYAVARQLSSGTVGHNSFRTDFGMGFGGFKQSGIGREGNIEGLYPYLEHKSVILEGVPSHVKG